MCLYGTLTLKSKTQQQTTRVEKRRKYKLPSGSPSSPGRTQPCKEEKKQRRSRREAPVEKTRLSMTESLRLIPSETKLCIIGVVEKVRRMWRTYLPLHSRLHAASVQSKSRTKVIGSESSCLNGEEWRQNHCRSPACVSLGSHHWGLI